MATMNTALWTPLDKMRQKGRVLFSGIKGKK
jgi:hypothetical protein